MKRAEIGIIGGTGIKLAFDKASKTRIGTPYGPSPTITIGKMGGKNIAFLPRHGETHVFPPHKINYRANIWTLYTLGVDRILATNAVGAINVNYNIGDLVVPIDFIDFTKSGPVTFYDSAPVTHVDMTEPYCPELMNALIETTEHKKTKVWNGAIYACTDGPRYETPAEIRMFRSLGCDIIGMTGIPEAVLAREVEICYVTLCYVSNMAAGTQKRLVAEEVAEIGRNIMPTIQQILKEVAIKIPNKKNCPCSHALEGARV